MGKIRIHRNCGGAIKHDICTKCGKKFGVKDKMFSNYSEEVNDPEDEFNATKYRKRIKNGEDIFK